MSIKIIAVMSLTLSLSVSLPRISDIYALPGSGGHSLGGAGGSNPISGNQPNSIGGGPRSVLNPTTNCIAPGSLFPSAISCGSPTVLHPANAPNTAVVQPSNCNIPTSAHTNTPNNIVVHPATTKCASPNSVHVVF